MEDIMKVCRKCGIEKDLSDYYKHSKMHDGHLNICIECTKIRISEHRALNIDKIREYDRLRGRLENRKTDNSNRRKKLKETNPELLRKMEYERTKANREKYKEKHRARLDLANALLRGDIKRPDMCQVCGIEKCKHGHHHDYRLPLDVIWVCIKCHGEIHKKLNEEKRIAERLMT
jgi:hypothetical protein